MHADVWNVIAASAEEVTVHIPELPPQATLKVDPKYNERSGSDSEDEVIRPPKPRTKSGSRSGRVPPKRPTYTTPPKKHGLSLKRLNEGI